MKTFLNRRLKIFMALLATGLLLTSILNVIERIYWSQPLVFESEESLDVSGRPVINSIQLIQKPGEDIWMMNQTHRAESKTIKHPERIFIRIKMKENNKTAEFGQIESGPLQWDSRLTEHKITSRVSCQYCHANGPRLIRPLKILNKDDSLAMAFVQQIKLQYWNYLIRSYGLIGHETGDNTIKNVNQDRLRQKHTNVLTLKSCYQCHNGKNRSILTEENFLAIRYMVKNKLMPPFEWTSNMHEIKKIEDFLGSSI